MKLLRYLRCLFFHICYRDRYWFEPTKYVIHCSKCGWSSSMRDTSRRLQSPFLVRRASTSRQPEQK